MEIACTDVQSFIAKLALCVCDGEESTERVTQCPQRRITPQRRALRSTDDHHGPGYCVVRKLQRTFNQMPHLRKQLTHPQTSEERRQSEQFCSAISQAVGQYMFDYYVADILRAGHISIDRLKKMHNIDCFSDPSGDYSALLKDLQHISPEEKTLLRSNRSYFHRVFGFLDAENRDAIFEAISILAEPVNADRLAG